jgi:hypothetical protein
MINTLYLFISFFRSFSRESIIEKKTLTNLLYEAGLNNEALNEQPAELSKYFGSGYGLKIWQYPNQFIDYLLFLSKHIDKIDSYLEIGSRHGGTYIFTVEFLTLLKKKSIVSYACDTIDIPTNIEYYNMLNSNSKYLQLNSQSSDFSKFISDKNFSVILIDGDHNYEPVKKDTENVLEKARIIVFHDITSDACPGTTYYWKEFRSTYQDLFDFYEFTDQYSSVNGSFLGIGCAIRKAF